MSVVFSFCKNVLLSFSSVSGPLVVVEGLVVLGGRFFGGFLEELEVSGDSDRDVVGLVFGGFGADQGEQKVSCCTIAYFLLTFENVLPG